MKILDRTIHHRTTPTGRLEPQLDRLVRLMLLNLALGVLVGVLTLALHDSILDHQVAHTGGQSRAALSTQLWSHPGPALAIALLYPLFIRRLRQHQRRGWRRTVVLSTLQLLSLVWFTVGVGYPDWLRGLQVLQMVTVGAVLVAATRPSVRGLFASDGDAAQTPTSQHVDAETSAR